MLLDGIALRPSRTHGLGLIAEAFIPRGTVVWYPCPQCDLFSASELGKLPEAEFQRLDLHGYYLVNGDIILPCRNACMMNHSCDANVLDFGLDFGVAIRDIEPRMEVTLDYATFQSDRPWRVECNCGAPACRGVIMPVQPNLEELENLWREKLTSTLPLVRTVQQPLGALLQTWSARYCRIFAGSMPQLHSRTNIRQPLFLSFRHSS